MEKKWVLILLLGLFFVNFVSAKIEISEPNAIYNIGDRLDFSITINPNSVSGFFEVNLICENNTLNLYKIPANEDSFPIGQENRYSNHITLTKDIIGEMKGNCYISSKLGNEQAKTKNFKISDLIIIESAMEKDSFNPKEELKLAIKATKESGSFLEGFLEISGSAELQKAVVNGMAEGSFEVPENMESGRHELFVYVYDRGKNGEVLNYGKKNISFLVNQVPTMLELSLSDIEIIPGNKFSVNSLIYDQAGKIIEGTINLRIIYPSKQEQQFSLLQGQTQEIEFPLNETPGNMQVIVSYDNLIQEKTIKIKELQKVSFEITDSDGILIVRNIGNVPYNKTIEINVGNETRKIEGIVLRLGEERKFKINGNGEYDVTVTDGETKEQKRVALTGQTISIEKLGQFNLFDYKIALIFLAIIIVGLIIVLIFKYKDRMYFPKYSSHSAPSSSSKFIPSPTSSKINTNREEAQTEYSFKTDYIAKKEKRDEEKKEEKKKELAAFIPKMDGGNAESTPILQGKKYPSQIIAVKISNLSRLKKGREEIEKIINMAKDMKTMIELKDSYLMIIISPLITKTLDNEMKAVQVASAIFQELTQYNKMAIDKIEFNIGINAGELLSAIENRKLKYTALGNSVLLARRIADSSSSQLLLAESVRLKLLRSVKTEQAGEIGKTKIYSVSRIADVDRDKQKLADLMKRMDYA
jgi:hypothetical protein